ncbi:PREDICTED: protein Tube [Vollenhovia emeryi]|uniref:protein Tube n=1 Tax=Vollenhovia emeryi TaxID=411798 RepID=UPI0005F51AAB|nr:PREDICTED: protein Tube [Vollenhovia emeryi]
MSYETSVDMELRKLRPSELYTLGTILNIGDSWKKLMSIVTKEGNVPKFSSDDIRLIEQAARSNKRNAGEIFLYEWGTMGRKRPTLKLLLELLTKAELFRAADYVACDILKQEIPKRPVYGPAASIDISGAVIINELPYEQMLPHNNFDVGSTSEISESNEIYPSEKDVQAAVPADRQAVQSYRYEEVLSEELPVFLNNCK